MNKTELQLLNRIQLLEQEVVLLKERVKKDETPGSLLWDDVRGSIESDLAEDMKHCHDSDGFFVGRFRREKPKDKPEGRLSMFGLWEIDGKFVDKSVDPWHTLTDEEVHNITGLTDADGNKIGYLKQQEQTLEMMTGDH